MMNKTEEYLNARIAQLEKRVSRANRNSMLIVLLVLLISAANVWWMSRPIRVIRLTDSNGTAELTATQLKMTDRLGSTMELGLQGLNIADSLGASSKVGTSVIALERQGGAVIQLFVVPEEKGKGILSLQDAKGGTEALYAEDLSKFKGAPVKAEAPNSK